MFEEADLLILCSHCHFRNIEEVSYESDPYFVCLFAKIEILLHVKICL